MRLILHFIVVAISFTLCEAQSNPLSQNRDNYLGVSLSLDTDKLLLAGSTTNCKLPSVKYIDLSTNISNLIIAHGYGHYTDGVKINQDEVILTGIDNYADDVLMPQIMVHAFSIQTQKIDTIYQIQIPNTSYISLFEDAFIDKLNDSLFVVAHLHNFWILDLFGNIQSYQLDSGTIINSIVTCPGIILFGSNQGYITYSIDSSLFGVDSFLIGKQFVSSLDMNTTAIYADSSYATLHKGTEFIELLGFEWGPKPLDFRYIKRIYESPDWTIMYGGQDTALAYIFSKGTGEITMLNWPIDKSSFQTLTKIGNKYVLGFRIKNNAYYHFNESMEELFKIPECQDIAVSNIDYLGFTYLDILSDTCQYICPAEPVDYPTLKVRIYFTYEIQNYSSDTVYSWEVISNDLGGFNCLRAYYSRTADSTEYIAPFESVRITDSLQQHASNYFEFALWSNLPNGQFDWCFGNDTASIIEALVNTKETLNPYGINIYPNPASKFIFIESSFIRDPVYINLYDLMGRLVLKERFFFGSSIDLSHLPNGLYMANIKSTNNMTIYSTSLIVSR